MTTIALFRDDPAATEYPAGRTIFEEGQAAKSMYAVVDGEVELRQGGRLIRTVGPGSIFGEMALVEHAPRSATATAKSACKLVEINERRFNFLVQQHPFFALQVMRIMSERLRERERG